MNDVIYDWNVKGHALSPRMRRVEIHDETLRDGIQSPSIHDPDIEDKRAILRLLASVGVTNVNVGLPGAGPRAVAHVTSLVETVRDEGLPVTVGAAARTHPSDIRPIVDIAEKTGVSIEIMTFLGSSPVRMLAERWDEERLETLTRDAVRLGAQAGLPVSFVTEDTVRSHPTTLRRLFTAAVEEGASRLVLCDTVGHATPNGVFNLVYFAHDLLVSLGMRDEVKLDWHGHNDRAHALSNALYAIEAGIDRVHGTILGIGERVGNTSLDQLLVNMKLLGVETGDLSNLSELVTRVSEACHWPIPWNYPVFGRDAFRTATGVHAAAIIKAKHLGDDLLADQVYSGVPASWFGREQEVAVGPMSGESNVRYWLQVRGIPAEEPLVKAIFERAKNASDLLPDDEILAICRDYPSPSAS